MTKRGTGSWCHSYDPPDRRWVAERTPAWITRHRRTIWEYERLTSRHETYLHWAMMIVMTCRLARTPGRTGTSTGPQVTKVFKQALSEHWPQPEDRAHDRRPVLARWGSTG